jgi:hypothetical protein
MEFSTLFILSYTQTKNELVALPLQRRSAFVPLKAPVGLAVISLAVSLCRVVVSLLITKVG